MANAVLKRILSIISDLDGNAESVAAEVEDLKNFPGCNQGRFYYESILERHPENSSLANSYYDDVMDTAIKFLRSSEFLDKHISVFRDLAPDKSALIFCHIPKTGGTTVSYGISDTVTRNISKKFIDRHTLSRDVYELIFEMIEEDLKFYNYFMSRAD